VLCVGDKKPVANTNVAMVFVDRTDGLPLVVSLGGVHATESFLLPQFDQNSKRKLLCRARDPSGPERCMGDGLVSWVCGQAITNSKEWFGGKSFETKEQLLQNTKFFSPFQEADDTYPASLNLKVNLVNPPALHKIAADQNTTKLCTDIESLSGRISPHFGLQIWLRVATNKQGVLKPNSEIAWGLTLPLQKALIHTNVGNPEDKNSVLFGDVRFFRANDPTTEIQGSTNNDDVMDDCAGIVLNNSQTALCKSEDEGLSPCRKRARLSLEGSAAVP